MGALKETLAALKAGVKGQATLAEMVTLRLNEALAGDESTPEALLLTALIRDLGSETVPNPLPMARTADDELDFEALKEEWLQAEQEEAEQENDPFPWPRSICVPLPEPIVGPGGAWQKSFIDYASLTNNPAVRRGARALRAIVRKIAAARALDPKTKAALVEWLRPALPLETKEEPPPARQRSQTPGPLPDLMKFPADRIHKGAIEAFSAVDQWDQIDGFHQAYQVSGSRAEFAMLCGFPVDPGPEVWRMLLSRGEAAIKAHYCLWARLYEQTGAKPGQYALININQLCHDLGYKPHHKGGFKRERKQEAARLMEALTSIEIAVRFQVAGKKGRIREVSGRLWERGFTARERDQYGDLFGQAREGDPELWDPAGFTYGPGPWFADPVWRRQNEYLGLIGAGLMKLQADTDQTAIRIGGYLGTLARFNQYRTRPIRIETLLKRIGMANKYPKNPQRLQENVEEAMKKLVTVGVLSRWGYTDEEPTEPDMDDPEELAALADGEEMPWRRKTMEIEWPERLIAENRRLEKAEQRAIATARKRENHSNPDTEGGS